MRETLEVRRGREARREKKLKTPKTLPDVMTILRRPNIAAAQSTRIKGFVGIIPLRFEINQACSVGCVCVI